jgi:hypothetical protein
MEIDKVVPVAASVKTKLGRGGGGIRPAGPKGDGRLRNNACGSRPAQVK